MKTIEKKSEHWNSGTSGIKDVVNECNEACMKCLSCPHNQNSHFNLILQELFNSWKNLGNIKWKDVNPWCDLN